MGLASVNPDFLLYCTFSFGLVPKIIFKLDNNPSFDEYCSETKHR